MSKSVTTDSTASGSTYYPQKDVLESASKMVSQHMRQDDAFSELIDCLKMGGELPRVSGLGNDEYPGFTELGLDIQRHAQLSVVKRIPLPSELVEQFGFMQTNCQMGLFAEIGRAWLTIDSNIFLWSFHDGSDLAYYDGINKMILCVGLVKPKPGVFQSFIHYVLCLATPSEIVLLGVSFSQQNESSPPFEEMHLLPEPLFSFPTDDVMMSCFAGTENGRIFLGGCDGSIYEFTYQACDGWFTKKCRKINHSSNSLSFLVPNFFQVLWSEEDPIQQISIDSSRNILYARTEKGTIQVFDLGEDGCEMRKILILHHQNILNSAAAIAKTVNETNFSPVVSICAVEANESCYVNLVAVTKSGVRLYFSANPDASSSRPYTLALLHVRLPPGFSAKAVVDQLTNVHLSIYKKGFVMMAASVVDDHDVLFAAGNDLFAFHKYLIETYVAIKLDGHAWAICEVPISNTFKSLNPVAVTPSTASVEPPLMVTQHAEYPRQFVVLSDQGCCILSKPRPVDQLCRLLIESKGPDSDSVKSFLKLFSKGQICAMCLVLICSHNLQDKQVAEWATRAFFLYGGDPGYTFQGGEPVVGYDSQVASSIPVWTSTPAPNVQQLAFTGSQANPQISAVGSPPLSTTPTLVSLPSSTNLQTSQFMPDTHGITSTTELNYSGKHNGLHLYFSRIIRPLWNMKVVYEKNRVVPDSGPPYLCSTISSETLSSFLQDLSSLKNFIQTYQPYFGNHSTTSTFLTNYNPQQHRMQSHSPTQDVTAQSQVQSKAQSDAEIQENASVLNLQLLVNYTCETLGLWKILTDHQFEAIIKLLSVNDQDQLKQITFKELIVDGKELCMALATGVINFYLEDNASTTAISERLRDICPSIFTTEDATISKAHEIIRKARITVNLAEKEKEMMEALKLCKSVTPNINLKAMCILFLENRFYYGLVDLCICMAQHLDPQNLALHYYNHDEPPHDVQGRQAFEVRMECYTVVTDTIKELVAASLSHPQSPCIPTGPGLQTAKPAAHLTPEEAKTDSELVFEMALKTDDELFHAAVYDWLISTDQTNALLSIKSFFLERYLKRRANMHPDSQQSLDLLWRFYEKNCNFSAAAKVLAKLADKPGIDLNLSQRIEYLSRAIVSIKSSEMQISTSGEGEFLHELEEKMEVARIQLQILQVFQQKKYPSGMNKILNVQRFISRLNSSFLDLTTLYEEFARPFNLPEYELAIVHCADHYEPYLIQSFWRKIVEKELANTSGKMPEARVKILQQKLHEISQPYINSEKYFPIAFLTEFLEMATCQMNLTTGWAFQLMLSLGFPLKELLNIYHKMYSTKECTWLKTNQPLHSLQVLSLLISEFIRKPQLVHQDERRAFVTQCLDVIAGYLVDLQATSIANPLVPILTNEFKSVQHKLERML